MALLIQNCVSSAARVTRQKINEIFRQGIQDMNPFAFSMRFGFTELRKEQL